MVEYFSLHLYTKGKTHDISVVGSAAAQKGIEMTMQLVDLARIAKGVVARPGICFDEWQVWDPGALAFSLLYFFTYARLTPNSCVPLSDCRRREGCEERGRLYRGRQLLTIPHGTGAEQVYTLSDALSVASWLNVFVRTPDVKIACLAQVSPPRICSVYKIPKRRLTLF